MCEQDNSIPYGQYLYFLQESQTMPHVLFQQSLKISLDGDMYCVLLGQNLMDGCAGFGKIMREAMYDFSDNFNSSKAPTPAKKL